VFSHNFGSKYETVSGTYTVPHDANAWFIQGILDFADPTDYDVSYFSIKRTRTTDTTENFQMCLSEKLYKVAGTLDRFETENFSINPADLANSDGIINFTASIGGNHYGMARLIYHAPLLMGRNARYKMNSVNGNTYDITLTTKLSAYSNTFKMFPFSTKYGGVEIWAEDGSGENHTSKNQNQWVSCNCSNSGMKVLITYPIQEAPRKRNPFSALHQIPHDFFEFPLIDILK
jgi:hypothetical protein